VVPAGNLAALRNVSSGDKGSTLTRSISVVLNAQETSPGSCPTGASSDPVSVSLSLLDDGGDPIPVSVAKSPVVCTAGQSVKAKFAAVYTGPENCKDGVSPPHHVSKGDVSITATSDHGTLNQTGKILCKNGS
jgi:hypothetical protein